MTRFLIAGAEGMLGTDLQRALTGRQVTAVGRNALDVTDLTDVRRAVARHDVVINAAAYTKVDDAESNEGAAHLVNAVGAQNLAIAASETGAKLVQLSTDYVFNGSATTPYDEDAPLDPISAYGRTKADGERLAVAAYPDGTWIVRTAWLYGAGGPNFARTMLKLATDHDTVRVVNDQIGQPTWTSDLAAQIVSMLDVDAPAGVYHGTNSGTATWFEFARHILEYSGLDPDRVLPTTSADFVRPAPRPSYSVLDHGAWKRAGMNPMRDWREALAEATGSGALEA